MAVHAAIFTGMSLVPTTLAEINVYTFTRKCKVKLCSKRSSGKFYASSFVHETKTENEKESKKKKKEKRGERRKKNENDVRILS